MVPTEEAEEKDHPGPRTLAAFLERLLDAADTEAVERHVSQCNRCNEVINVARRFQSGWPPR